MTESHSEFLTRMLRDLSMIRHDVARRNQTAASPLLKSLVAQLDTVMCGVEVVKEYYEEGRNQVMRDTELKEVITDLLAFRERIEGWILQVSGPEHASIRHEMRQELLALRTLVHYIEGCET